LTVRRQLQGQRRNVLHLLSDTLMSQESAQSAQSTYSGDLECQSFVTGGTVGPIPGSDVCITLEEPAQQITTGDRAGANNLAGQGPIGPFGPIPETYTPTSSNSAHSETDGDDGRELEEVVI